MSRLGVRAVVLGLVGIGSIVACGSDRVAPPTEEAPVAAAPAGEGPDAIPQPDPPTPGKPKPAPTTDPPPPTDLPDASTPDAQVITPAIDAGADADAGPACTPQDGACGGSSASCCGDLQCNFGKCGSCKTDEAYCPAIGGCISTTLECSTFTRCPDGTAGICWSKTLRYDCTTKKCECPAAYPRYCSDLGGACWPSAVACGTATTCPDAKTYACTTAGMTVDCAAKKCVCAGTTKYCPAVGTTPGGCWPANTNCASLTTCDAKIYACGQNANYDCTKAGCFCDVGLSACGTDCWDLSKDANNCGACGRKCATGFSCKSGQCVDSTNPCAPGQTLCGGFCRDLRNDDANCGQCRNSCYSLGGTTCYGGFCTSCYYECRSGSCAQVRCSD